MSRHPDYLLASITYEQFCGWMRYWEAEPWGDIRADDRNAVLATYLLSPTYDVELPELTYPYFPEAADEKTRWEALKKRAATLQQDGHLNLKTRRDDHRGHLGPGKRDEARRESGQAVPHEHQ